MCLCKSVVFVDIWGDGRSHDGDKVLDSLIASVKLPPHVEWAAVVLEVGTHLLHLPLICGKVVGGLHTGLGELCSVLVAGQHLHELWRLQEELQELSNEVDTAQEGVD